MDQQFSDEHGLAELVVERGEPFLLPLPCGLTYALQRP
jgi:hypothetical protein